MALERILNYCEEIDHHLPVEEQTGYRMLDDFNIVNDYLQDWEGEFNEWCVDCKEYDKVHHCCPRYNRVIKEALTEIINSSGKEI